MSQVFSWRMLCLSLLLPLAGSGLVAQGQPPAAPPAQPPVASDQNPDPNRQVIRRNLDIVTTDVIVRDNRGQFVADLNKDDFEVYEDGVKQDVQSFVLTHGGRVYNQTLPTPPQAAARYHPAAVAADQRCGGAHLRHLHRRPASRFPQHRPHPRFV